MNDRQTASSPTLLPKVIAAAPHPRERERLSRLRELVPDQREEDPVLEGMAKLTALVCDTPMAIVTLVDEKSVRFMASQGIEKVTTPRDLSLCAHVVEGESGPFIIPDTLGDARFARHPSVIASPFVRYYAGVPLLSDDGLPIGTLCVIDCKPRKPTERHLESMKKIAQIIMARFAQERFKREMIQLLHLEKDIYHRLMKASLELLKTTLTFDEALGMLVAQIDPELGWLSLRLRSMQTDEKHLVKNRPGHEGDPELQSAWRCIDGMSPPVFEDLGKSAVVESPALKPGYSYLVVPVRIRNHLAATIEFIYPDHRAHDDRLKELFDIVSFNLSVFAERELVNIELRHQATHDSLTGAANRYLILEEIKGAIGVCNPLEPDTALLFFDVDGFKEVNDNFGHESGDRLLREITRRLQGVCRSNDLLGRLSGDEFILLARGIDIEHGLTPLLERIQRNLSVPYMLGDLEIHVHSSIGCAVISGNDMAPNEILRRAEEAMYLVKNGERRDFCIADEAVVGNFREKRRLERNVKQAFRDGGIFALFQPIVDLATGSFTGCETMVRLRCRDGTVMSGDDYIPIIQHSRFQIQLDDFALSETLRCFRNPEGRKMLEHPGFRFTVNVSPAFLATDGYAENCLRSLEEAVIPPSSLGIEITECMVLPAEKTVIHNLELLRERGVTVALDDFGTGYSNLQHLASFPIDTIKIDRAFVEGIAMGDLTKNSLLGAILAIGKNLGYKIIAEGVETRIQGDYLKSVGCDYAQGYLYGMPMPIGDLLALVGDHTTGRGAESAVDAKSVLDAAPVMENARALFTATARKNRPNNSIGPGARRADLDPTPP